MPCHTTAIGETPNSGCWLSRLDRQAGRQGWSQLSILYDDKVNSWEKILNTGPYTWHRAVHVRAWLEEHDVALCTTRFRMVVFSFSCSSIGWFSLGLIVSQ